MSRKSFYYQGSKRLSISLNIPLQGRWIGSTTLYWKNQAKRLVSKYRGRQITTMLENNNFQGILDAVLNGSRLTNNQAESFWNRLQGIARYKIEVDGNFFPVNQTTKTTILNWLINGIRRIDVQQNTSGSDNLIQLLFDDPRSVRLQRMVIQQPKIKNKNGRFFPYINTSGYDLTRYQIYDQDQSYNLDNGSLGGERDKREHCLIYALELLEIKPSLIENVKRTFVNGSSFRKKI